MSKYPFFLRWIFLPLATVLGVALTMTARTEALGSEAARLDGFTQADGVSVFALTLKPSLPAVDGPRDVVILFSTAASQAGDFRAKSLATLQATLSKLEPRDRVKLVAFDLNAAPLTRGFVAPDSPAMTEAFAALLRRTPLGACDLEKALDTAAKSFADSKSARAIVYFGDGSSRANPLSTGQLDRLVGDLLSLRAPLIAFGVGPQIQEQMLGALASRSGGLVAARLHGHDVQGEACHSARYGDDRRGHGGKRVAWPAGGTVPRGVREPVDRPGRETGWWLVFRQQDEQLRRGESEVLHVCTACGALLQMRDGLGALASRQGTERQVAGRVAQMAALGRSWPAHRLPSCPALQAASRASGLCPIAAAAPR